MSAPVLTFFNNKGGVGKTSLVYHVAWMLADLDHRVLVADLDPQANLTAAFVGEDVLEDLWNPEASSDARTVFQAIRPLTQVADIREPRLLRMSGRLSLLPGDLALSGFEDQLSAEWPTSLGSGSLYRPFRILTAFWQVLQMSARQCGADIVLVDVGPSLGVDRPEPARQSIGAGAIRHVEATPLNSRWHAIFGTSRYMTYAGCPRSAGYPRLPINATFVAPTLSHDPTSKVAARLL